MARGGAAQVKQACQVTHRRDDRPARGRTGAPNGPWFGATLAARSTLRADAVSLDARHGAPAPCCRAWARISPSARAGTDPRCSDVFDQRRADASRLDRAAGDHRLRQQQLLVSARIPSRQPARGPNQTRITAARPCASAGGERSAIAPAAVKAGPRAAAAGTIFMRAWSGHVDEVQRRGVDEILN